MKTDKEKLEMSQPRFARVTHNTNGWSYPSYSRGIISGNSFPGIHKYGFDEYLRFSSLLNFQRHQVGFIEAMKKQSAGFSCNIYLFTYTRLKGYEEIGYIKNCTKLLDQEMRTVHRDWVSTGIAASMDSVRPVGEAPVGSKAPDDVVNVKFRLNDICIYNTSKSLPSFNGLRRYRYGNLY